MGIPWQAAPTIRGWSSERHFYFRLDRKFLRLFGVRGIRILLWIPHVSISNLGDGCDPTPENKVNDIIINL